MYAVLVYFYNITRQRIQLYVSIEKQEKVQQVKCSDEETYNVLFAQEGGILVCSAVSYPNAVFSIYPFGTGTTEPAEPHKYCKYRKKAQ